MHPVFEALVSGEPALGDTEGARQFVLKHGLAFTAAPIPKGIRRRQPGECYRNCARFVLDARPAFSDVRYVEGYAMRPSLGVLIKHAWLARNDEAFDITWRDFSGGDNQDCHYFGVAFATKAVGAIIAERRYFGLLDPADDVVTSNYTGEECLLREAA